MRRELTRRPLLLAACALALGMVLPREPILALFLAGVLFIAEGFGQRVAVLCLAILGVLRAPPQVHFLTENQFVQGIARVASVPRIAADGQTTIVEVQGLRLSIFLPTEPDITYGDRLRITGVAKPPREGSEPFLLGKGAVGRLDFADASLMSKGPAFLHYGLKWRDSFRSMTEKTLSPKAKEMADALCFNVDANLDSGLKDNLRRTGTVHIISASGLHVGLFAFFLQWLLSKMPIDRRWQLAILILVLLAYMGATGMRPPVVRAVVMAATILCAYLWKREGDMLSSLGFAALIQLMWDPWSVLDLGLHLSFVAVLGLGLFVRFDAVHGGFWDRIKVRGVQTVHSSIVASLATAPITAWSFGYISTIAPLSNLLIAPLVMVIVPLSLVAWAFAWVQPAAQTLMLPVEWSCKAMAWLVDHLARIPFSSFDVPAFSAWWIPVAYLALMGLWRKRVRPT